MVYCYLRVSTDRQTVENQRFELESFAKRRGFIIETWVEETMTGKRKKTEGKFGRLMNILKKGDVILVTELSRLGRNMMEIMSILNDFMNKEIRIYTAKEGYELGDNISSKVLAFAFGLAAEIERQLISQRTKEALARKRAEGIILGRPKGKKSAEHKLDLKFEQIFNFLKCGFSLSEMSRRLKCHRITVKKQIFNNEILKKQYEDFLIFKKTGNKTDYAKRNNTIGFVYDERNDIVVREEWELR